MKKFLEEFKAFALKGNMMDMAIGVLIGILHAGHFFDGQHHQPHHWHFVPDRFQ